MLKQFHSAYSARTISIYERSTRKFKSNLSVWLDYIAWCQKKGMRIVLGRVLARALALHPLAVQMWLIGAEYELNENQSSNSARVLLQRGWRLIKPAATNASSTRNGKKKARSEEVDQRPNKKSRIDETGASGTSFSSPQPSRLAAERIARQFSFQLSSQQERDYVQLAVAYLRMELVFMERLRRRWTLLGIDTEGSSAQTEGSAINADAAPDHGTSGGDREEDDDEKADQEEAEAQLLETVQRISAEQTEGDDAEEATGPKPVENSISAAEKVAEASRVSAHAQLPVLQGAIVRIAIKSTLENLSVDGPARWVFLTECLALLFEFPLIDSNDRPGSGKQLRNDLVGEVLKMLESLGPSAQADAGDLQPTKAEIAFVTASIREIAMPGESWAADNESIEQEMESNHHLRVSSNLLQPISSQTYDAEGPVGFIVHLLAKHGVVQDEQFPVRITESSAVIVKACLALSDLGTVEAQREAARLATLQTKFALQLKKTRDEAVEDATALETLISSIVELTYKTARKHRFLTHQNCLAYFQTSTSDMDKEKMKSVMELCEKVGKRLGLMDRGVDEVERGDETVAAAKLWLLYVEQHLEPSPAALHTQAALAATFEEYVQALKALPEAGPIWEGATSFIESQLASRDRESDDFVWSKLDYLCDLSRRSLQRSDADPDRFKARQVVHDQMLFRVFSIAQQMRDGSSTWKRSEKSKRRAIAEAHKILMKDSTASDRFWVEVCRTWVKAHAKTLHELKAQAENTDDTPQKRPQSVQEEANIVERLFAKVLVKSQAGSPDTFVDVRTIWLNYLLRLREDPEKALAALQAARRDAATFGPSVVAAIEAAWSQLCGRQSDSDSDSHSSDDDDEDEADQS